MRVRLFSIVLICVMGISSCKVKSYRERNAHYFDIANQLSFIESNVINSNDNNFKIDIRFGHNNINTLKSELSVSSDSVKIRTKKEMNSRITVDTIFTVSKTQILKEIEFQKVNAKNIIVLAGHYQLIMISKDDKFIRYPTTRVGKYLIEFLEECELHYE